MIEQLTKKDVLRWARCIDRTTCTGLRMACAYAVYGLEHPTCRFFFVTGGGAPGALMVAGRSALFCGAPGCEEELAAFLRLLDVCSFQSESVLLPGWTPAPRLVMRAPAQAEPTGACAVDIDTQPDLWALAHSGLLPDIDPEAWYADACARCNRGMAAVYAVRGEQGYVAMAYAQCLAPEGMYITAVFTAPEHRKRGCATALLHALRQKNAECPALLLCEPRLRRFYEKQGWQLVHPLCEYRRCTDAHDA